MFDINKVNMNDLETLLKVMTAGIATYDVVLRDFPGEGKTPLVDIFIRANGHTCVYTMLLYKDSLAGLENMFPNFYSSLNIPDPEIEYKKRRYYLYS